MSLKGNIMNFKILIEDIKCSNYRSYYLYVINISLVGVILKLNLLYTNNIQMKQIYRLKNIILPLFLFLFIFSCKNWFAVENKKDVDDEDELIEEIKDDQKQFDTKCINDVETAPTLAATNSSGYFNDDPLGDAAPYNLYPPLKKVTEEAKSKLNSDDIPGMILELSKLESILESGVNFEGYDRCDPSDKNTIDERINKANSIVSDYTNLYKKKNNSIARK